VVGFEYFSGAFANDDAGSHRVAGSYAWHDRPIRNTKFFYSINFEIAVNHRHGVSAHFGGARLMPVSHGGIPDEVFELCTFKVARLPGITSRLMNGRSGAELPISRQSSTQAIAAFISSG
jgi:hypothetical protein